MEHRLPSGFAHASGTSSSFSELLSTHAPEALPTVGSASAQELVPHGTTILSLTYPGGVLMAGDRRATMGNLIAHRRIRKVFPADEYSCVGIAGTAGIAIEMVRLFRVELEHYEKIEGTLMSLEGKANRLAHMIRGNLGMAMQGLAVVPLFSGYDLDAGVGRIFSYDVTGGRYEEHRHHAVGSGSLFARGSLNKLYRPSHNVDEAVRVALEALWDAADDDTATGGPDVGRGVYPIVATVSASGYEEVPEDTLARVTAQIIEDRRELADGEPTGGNA